MQTLTRISIWLPPARPSGFEADFNEVLLPVLRRHGLDDPAVPDRPALPGVFSFTRCSMQCQRLFSRNPRPSRSHTQSEP